MTDVALFLFALWSAKCTCACKTYTNTRICFFFRMSSCSPLVHHKGRCATCVGVWVCVCVCVGVGALVCGVCVSALLCVCVCDSRREGGEGMEKYSLPLFCCSQNISCPPPPKYLPDLPA